VVMVRSEPSEWRLPSNAMGAVLSRDGPQTEVYVFFHAVARALGHGSDALKKRWPTARERRDLSRALARVIVHEVIHAVLPSRDHAPAGLTREVLDRDSLLDPGVEIEPVVAEAFRSALSTRSLRSSRGRNFDIMRIKDHPRRANATGAGSSRKRRSAQAAPREAR